MYDKFNEELKRMFYQVALATERKRKQLDDLRELNLRFPLRALTAAAVAIAVATGAASAEQIIRLKDDGTYPRTAMFLRCKHLAELTIEHAVRAGRHKAHAMLHGCDEQTANDVANLLEDNGYEIDEESRVLNPFVLNISWEPFLKSAERDEKVQAWWATFRQNEAEMFKGGN